MSLQAAKAVTEGHSATANESDHPVLLCTTESDAHTVANKLLELYLRDHGWRVVNLGVCTPLEECLSAAATLDPIALVIGTQNGHALEDLGELRVLRSRFGVELPIVVGGNLSVGARKRTDVAARLISLGVDRIISDFDELQGYLGRLASRTAEDAARTALDLAV